MAKKKKTPLSVSQEETVQAQHVFEHYHQVAHNLCMSKDQKQAETALAEITTLPENAQIALLKALIGFIGFMAIAIKLLIFVVFLALFAGVGFMALRAYQGRNSN